MTDMSKLALITGTSRGLGEAAALELLARGWHVSGVARGPASERLSNERYIHTQLDLSNLAAVEAHFEGTFLRTQTFADHECVALVNNAGVLDPVAPIHTLEPGPLAEALIVNCVTPTWLMGFFVRYCERVPLRVVNVSSGAATSPYPGWGAYCASKSALAMTGRVLEQELAEVAPLVKRDVRILSWAPGVVATRMQESLRATSEDRFPRRAKFIALHEEGRLAQPAAPARELADLLESDLPRYSERRFGG